jgi:hypothetical protein
MSVLPPYYRERCSIGLAIHGIPDWDRGLVVSSRWPILRRSLLMNCGVTVCFGPEATSETDRPGIPHGPSFFVDTLTLGLDNPSPANQGMLLGSPCGIER